MNAARIFGKQTLIRRVHAATAYPPLSPVGVPRDHKVYIKLPQKAVVIFGMMAQEQLIALLCGKPLEPRSVGGMVGTVQGRSKTADGYTTPRNELLIKEDRARLPDRLTPRWVYPSTPVRRGGGMAKLAV